MADLIDIQAVRDKLNGPDANCVSTDQDGHPLFLFSIGYRHADRRYSIDIWARSERDAAEQIISMRETLWLEGRVVALETCDV
jgi:hypothetical protein